MSTRMAPSAALEAAIEELLAERLGETSCLSLCWAVLDLFIASARRPSLTALEHRQLALMRAARAATTPATMSA